jgi:hypothetical protein
VNTHSEFVDESRVAAIRQAHQIEDSAHQRTGA